MTARSYNATLCLPDGKTLGRKQVSNTYLVKTGTCLWFMGLFRSRILLRYFDRKSGRVKLNIALEYYFTFKFNTFLNPVQLLHVLTRSSATAIFHILMNFFDAVFTDPPYYDNSTVLICRFIRFFLCLVETNFGGHCILNSSPYFIDP